MSRFLKVSIFLVAAGLVGCQPQPADTTPQPDYFPLNTGRFWIYEVINQKYAIGAVPEIDTSIVRENLLGPELDTQGISIYGFQQSIQDESGRWLLDSLGQAWKTFNSALRRVNGQTFVKLLLPVADSQSWDANQFNNLAESIALAHISDSTIRINDFAWNNCLMVTQANDSTLLSQQKNREVYADGIGLVLSEQISVNFCADASCLGKGQIEYGNIKLKRLISYGQQPVE